jgi:outer membrane biosynthesis protein TonB
MADPKRGLVRDRKWLAPTLVGVGALAIVGLVISALRGSSSPPKPAPFIETMNVRVVPLPPPPPPPPPPPTPKKTLEEIKEKDLQDPTPEIPNQPKSPAKLAAPPGPLQTNGPLGNDAFGLGQGNGGGGGGGGGKGYGGFVSSVTEKLQLAISRDEKLRYGKYRVRVTLWISDDGRPERCVLVDTTGDSGMDSAICRDAQAIPVYAQPPADHRGQAITVRLGGAQGSG